MSNLGISILAAGIIAALLSGGQGGDRPRAPSPDVSPASDPGNAGNWVLRSDLSDEFEGSALDTDKWHRQGEGGEYVFEFAGRAPSQFAPENVRVEDGKLKLAIKWDPDYDFVDYLDPDCDCPYET